MSFLSSHSVACVWLLPTWCCVLPDVVCTASIYCVLVYSPGTSNMYFHPATVVTRTPGLYNWNNTGMVKLIKHSSFCLFSVTSFFRRFKVLCLEMFTIQVLIFKFQRVYNHIVLCQLPRLARFRQSYSRTCFSNRSVICIPAITSKPCSALFRYL